MNGCHSVIVAHTIATPDLHLGGDNLPRFILTNHPHFPTMSFSKYATPEDFQRWEDHAKVLDCYTLKYIIKDCQSAQACMRGFDTIREGYYSDQAATYGMELTRRNRLLPAALRHRV